MPPLSALQKREQAPALQASRRSIGWGGSIVSTTLRLALASTSSTAAFNVLMVLIPCPFWTAAACRRFLPSKAGACLPCLPRARRGERSQRLPLSFLALPGLLGKKKGSPDGVRAPCLFRGKEQLPVAILGRDVEQRAVAVNAGHRRLTVPVVHKALGGGNALEDRCGGGRYSLETAAHD